MSTRLALLAFLIVCASVSQHYSGTVRAQTRHLGANVVAWQTLQSAKHVPTSYKGDPNAVAKLQSGAAPLAMASADFDGDGVADLVIGFAHSGGGVLALHRGNLDAFAPQSHASWLAIAHEQFPSPFLSQATAIEVPQAPHLLVTGDFNGDGHIDILTGAPGSERLYLLIGNGKGKFSDPQAITLPGKLTALAAGEVGVRDGKTDVVAGIQTANAAAVLVYKGSAGGLSTAAVAYPVPQAAKQLEIADLHGDGFSDIAVLAGTELLIVHPTAVPGAETSALVERVPVGNVPRSIAVGGFVWDRHGRNQLAVLSQSGIVQVLAHGELDTRPFTEEERFARRSAVLRAKLPSELKAPWSGQSEPWNVVKSGAVSGPLAGNVRLMAVGMAHARPQDLMVVDSSDSRLHVLPANTSGDSADASGELTVETGDAPVAVLPVRVNTDARPGLVMVGRSASHPRTMAPRPDPTYTVNRLDDPPASTNPVTVAAYCVGVANDCSFRQAVIKANTTPGSDTIMLPAGTITLTQTGLAENDAVTGDVDVRDDLSIVGLGTVITGGVGWNDKFISTNKIGDTSASLSICCVTFQNGNNTNASGGATFDYLGGAVDFFGCAPEGGGCNNGVIDLPVASLSVNTIQFINNTAAGCGAGNDCGGGLDSEFGPTTIAGAFFSGNTATLGRGGALTLVGAKETMSVTNGDFGSNHSAQEGGALYIDFQNTSGTGSISIHHGHFNNNTAGADGGGIYVNLGSGGNQTTATIDQGAQIGGNTSFQRGGGLVFFGITGTIATPGTTSLSINKVTINSNDANGGSSDGGGGIFVASGGTLNLQFSRIVNNTTTASGKPTGMSIEAGTMGSASTVNAAYNWWGCNTGPSASPCDTVDTVNGASPTATVAPWIVLTLAASPTSVQAVAPNNTSSLTADFLHDSASGAISLSNIDRLLGLPITFGATAGSISGAQATIQSNGTATATFTHDANCNASSATATVDTNPPPTVTTPITILCPDLTASKINSITGNTTNGTVPLSGGSASWDWSVTVANTGPGATADATFADTQTILTDTLPGTNITYGTPTAGTFSSVTGSANISCGITSNVLTCKANGGSVTIGHPGSFVVTVHATATAIGTYTNPTSGSCAVDPNNNIIESNESNNDCNSNSVTVTAPDLTATKTNSVSGSVPLSTGTWSWTVAVANSGNASATFADTQTILSDHLPSTNITYGSPTPGTFSGIANSANISCGISSNVLTCTASGAAVTIAAPGSFNVVFTATATVAGAYANPTGGTCSVDPNNNVSESNEANNACSDSVTVVAPPTISKVFSPTSVALNGVSTLTFTLSNPNTGTALTGVAFSDTLPTGLVVNTPNGAVNNCGGSLTAAAASGSISSSGVTIAASGSCTISVDVKGTTGGSKANTTGTITSTNGGTGATSNTATLTVASPPTISKAFLPTSIAVGGTSTVTFSIANPNSSLALTGVAFSDTLVSGLVVATPNGASNTCSGTLSATAGSSSIGLTGGTLASSGSCSISVNVTATSAGSKSNTTGAISSTETGAGATSNTATLTVVAPPTISKAFGATSIPLNGSTSVTFTINNPNTGTPLTGIAFSDTLVSGLVVATPNGSSNTCGGTLTATAGSSSISLSGGALAISGSCSISVNVTGTTAGSKSNTTGVVTSTEGGTGSSSNTVTLAVVAPPSISKAFSPTSTSVGGTSTLTLTITNPNTGTALSGVAVSDTFPTGLQVAAVPGSSNTCGGTFAPVAGDTTISLTGGTIAASSSCAVSVNVTPTTSGSKLNTTGNVSSTNGGTGNTASATLGAGDFTIAVSPTTQTIPPGHKAVYTLTLSSTTGFQGTINLTCSGGPPNSTCTVVPSSVTLTSGSETAKVTVDLAVPKGASKGTFTLTFTGTSGTLTHSTTAKLMVGK